MMKMTQCYTIANFKPLIGIIMPAQNMMCLDRLVTVFIRRLMKDAPDAIFVADHTRRHFCACLVRKFTTSKLCAYFLSVLLRKRHTWLVDFFFFLLCGQVRCGLLRRV